MTPLIPIAVVGTGLFFLLRKKKPAPFVASAAPARAIPAAAAPSAAAPAPQDAADQAIVEEALAQFATERDFPIAEQSVEKFSRAAPPTSALSSPVEQIQQQAGQVEEPQGVFAALTSDPLGALGNLLGSDDDDPDA